MQTISLSSVSTVDGGIRAENTFQWQNGWDPTVCKLITIASGSASSSYPVQAKVDIFRVEAVKDYNVGNGGAGTYIDLYRVRGSSSSSIGRVPLFTSNTGSVTAMSFYTGSNASLVPGDYLKVDRVQDTGSSACVLQIFAKLS